jgi:hypothetical protein
MAQTTIIDPLGDPPVLIQIAALLTQIVARQRSAFCGSGFNSF